MQTIGLGRDPGAHGLFVFTHTHHHYGVSFIEHAQAVEEEYTRLARQLESTEDMTLNLADVFYSAIGGHRKKHRLYDLGTVGSVYYGVQSSTTRASTSRDASDNQDGDSQMQAHIDRLFIIIGLRLCEKLPSRNGESIVDCNNVSSIPSVSFTIEDKIFELTLEQKYRRKETAENYNKKDREFKADGNCSWEAMYQQLRLEPYAVHTTFQYAGTEGKHHQLREGMIFYDCLGYYDAPGWVPSRKQKRLPNVQLLQL